MHEMEVNDDYEQPSWQSFPAEILIKIFKYLDAKDLLACRSVSASWRANADYLGENCGVWLQLMNRLQNKGYSARQRTTLNYTGLYQNYYMWYAVKKAQVISKYVYKLKAIRNIHVYRDNLIVVLARSVKFFNLETGTLVKELLQPCFDYQETDYWLVKIYLNEGQKDHVLYSKQKVKSFETLAFRIYSVHHNKCQLTTWNNSIDFYEYTSKDVVKWSLSRCFSLDQFLALHMYEDDMFVYEKTGKVLHCRSGERKLTNVCTLDVPTRSGIWASPREGFRAMFNKNSVVFGVNTEEEEGIKRNFDIYGNEHLVLMYNGLMCALPHDDILLLGFEDGKVGVVIIKNLWTTNDVTPDVQFYIHEVAAVQRVEAIKFLEVYEGDGCHHVIVGTENNLYQVVLSHADYTIVKP